MKPIRCLLGFHTGTAKPAHEIDEPIPHRSAFVCSRCGHVNPLPPAELLFDEGSFLEEEP